MKKEHFTNKVQSPLITIPINPSYPFPEITTVDIPQVSSQIFSHSYRYSEKTGSVAFGFFT